MTRLIEFADTWHLPRSLCYRLPLVLVAVVICYQFEWGSLRYFTSEIMLRFAEWRGFPAKRLGPDLISWGGGVYQFAISCTYADVFCGALPLLWIQRFGVVRNLANITGFAIGLFVFNIFHLCLTDIIFSAGAPWLIADQVIGGIAYFAVWICLIRWLEFHEGHSDWLIKQTGRQSIYHSENGGSD